MRYFTNAPAVYDYDYTTEVLSEATHELYPGRGNTPPAVVHGREVEIPAKSAQYQTDRYLSGSYVVAEVKAPHDNQRLGGLTGHGACYDDL